MRVVRPGGASGLMQALRDDPLAKWGDGLRPGDLWRRIFRSPGEPKRLGMFGGLGFTFGCLLYLIIYTGVPRIGMRDKDAGKNVVAAPELMALSTLQEKEKLDIPGSSQVSEKIQIIELELGEAIRNMSLNDSYVNEPIQELIQLMKNDSSLLVHEALGQLQEKELELRNRVHRVWRSIENKNNKFYVPGVPMKLIDGGTRPAYRIKGKWFVPPVNPQPGPEPWPAPTTSPPMLPYTGVYDRDMVRWVQHNDKITPYQRLGQWERIKRTRPPWCTLTESEKENLLSQVLNAVSKHKGQPWCQEQLRKWGWDWAQPVCKGVNAVQRGLEGDPWYDRLPPPPIAKVLH